MLAGYWSHFETVDAQVKQALDQNNWKIFGRVISRQSLLALSRDLDDIRRGATQLNTSGENAAMLDSLGQSETHFRTMLDQNAMGLQRSQGAQWVAGLREEFGAALGNRARLAELDGQNPRGLGAFERGAEEFAGVVRGISGAARRQARVAGVGGAGVGGAGATPGARSEAGGRAVAGSDTVPATRSDRSAVATAGGAQGAHSDAAQATRVGATGMARAGHANKTPPDALPSPETSALPPTAPNATGGPVDSAAGAAEAAAPVSAPAGKRAMIASISGLVLLILFVISVATVRSIVIPIRQFMTTTERLASGDDTARFTRGGIKELDALAISFNRMAASLADARTVTREYQGELESRVDERTRQLQHLAEHDPLTGLPNRRHLVAHLDSALQKAARSGQRVAVFFLDLDNFKNINDSMGHAFGDVVLQGVAQRLRETAGPTGFAARIGGDEFTVVYENAGGRSEVSEAGNALVRAFQKPLSIEGRELIISISGGASIYPDHERGSDALLRAADAALFRAKNSGRARLSLFSPELLEAASLKFSLEQGLRRAVERGEFELWFQPEVSFNTLGTKLVEALLRWRLPDGQYIAPADFLSVAEDSGLIRSINDWVMRTAFRHAAEWHHGVWPEARVAINVSARQLLDTSFVARICELLEEYRLPPRCIEIELTETVLQTEAATIEVLRELRRLDISVALDDFGSRLLVALVTGATAAHAGEVGSQPHRYDRHQRPLFGDRASHHRSLRESRARGHGRRSRAVRAAGAAAGKSSDDSARIPALTPDQIGSHAGHAGVIARPAAVVAYHRARGEGHGHRRSERCGHAGWQGDAAGGGSAIERETRRRIGASRRAIPQSGSPTVARAAGASKAPHKHSSRPLPPVR